MAPRKLTSFESRVVNCVREHPGETVSAYHRWLYLPPRRAAQVGNITTCLERLVTLGHLKATEANSGRRYHPKQGA